MANTKKLKAKKVTKKSTAGSAPSLPQLQAASEKARKDHGKSENSRKDYDGYLKNTRKFLTTMIDGHIKTGDRTPMELKELKSCLEQPNKWTAEVLQLFIVHKCFTEGRGKSTADGIQAAWADFFDNIEGYEGTYSYDPVSGVNGNPARARKVMDTVHNVKKRDRDGGAAATRNHADAITIEEIRTLYQYSMEQCPQALVKRFLHGNVNSAEYELVQGHVMMRAFISTAFTLWTRNFETCQIKAGDITWNCFTEDEKREPHFRVFLRERKGHLNKSDSECSRESNTYQIHPQRDLPEIDMNALVPIWKLVLEKMLGRPLLDQELLFPYIAPNCVVHSTTELNQVAIQGKIDELATTAGLTRHFTTHSFRRGGAQYRFMFAPLGERWSLKIVRWWGGWAQNEGVNTLMNYLLDALGRYENSYGDALYTTRVDRDNSFMGDQSKLKGVTVQDLQQSLRSERLQTEHALQRVCTAAYSQLQASIFSHPVFVGPSSQPRSQFPTTQTTITEYQPTTGSLSYRYSTATAMPSTYSSSLAGALGFASMDTCYDRDMSYPTCYPSAHSQSHSDVAILSSLSGSAALRPSASPVAPGQRNINVGPPPGLCIPNLPKTKNGWRTAVDQWFDTDPKTQLALKDWPREWYTGKNKFLFGTKRSNRKLIALEWERLGSNDASFLREYGSASQTLTRLYKAIRTKQGSRRKSKNGTPTERDEASSSDDDAD